MNAPKHIVIVRPCKMREQFAQELGAALQLDPKLWERAEALIKLVVNTTRSDIDNGASGYVMVDENFEPTGAPAPDPESAHCLVCRQRIWAHDDRTAYPIQIGFDSNSVDVAGGACCPRCSEMSNAELFAKLTE